MSAGRGPAEIGSEGGSRTAHASSVGGTGGVDPPSRCWLWLSIGVLSLAVTVLAVGGDRSGVKSRGLRRDNTRRDVPGTALVAGTPTWGGVRVALHGRDCLAKS